MKKYRVLTASVNILGSFIWFFNYFVFNSLLCLGIGATMILIAAVVLTADRKLDRMK